MTQLALSSFWMSGRDKRPLDFFIAGTDLGFDSFELSGIHHDTFYEEVRPGNFRIISLHDPAPPARGQTRVGSKELRRADIVYTSLDEERCRRAVAITKRTIDVAADYGAQAIVVHLGQTSVVTDVEPQLKRLFINGQISSRRAIELRALLMSERAHQHAEHLDALHRSLDDLVDYAFARQIKLGIENRPTHEIAGYAEIGEVLAWYDERVIGYWHDTGHAQVQANLGFTSHIDWLRAYGHRIIGLHLHDVVGIDNHRAPGSGNVDWTGLASCVPVDALRVIEVDNTVSIEQLRAGVSHLQKTGWVKNES